MIFGEKKLLIYMRLFSLCNFSETFLNPRRSQPDIITNLHIGIHEKHPLFFSGFNQLNFPNKSAVIP
jgi:hypothetical protein